jgi:hypothetical protein
MQCLVDRQCYRSFAFSESHPLCEIPEAAFISLEAGNSMQELAPIHDSTPGIALPFAPRGFPGSIRPARPLPREQNNGHRRPGFFRQHCPEVRLLGRARRCRRPAARSRCLPGHGQPQRRDGPACCCCSLRPRGVRAGALQPRRYHQRRELGGRNATSAR